LTVYDLCLFSYDLHFPSLAGTSTNEEIKEIIYEYKKKEQHAKCNINIPYENLIRQIKCIFNLPIDSSIIFINAVTNEGVLTSKTADLWDFADVEVPRYKLVVHGKSGNKIIF
jgi:hypothetical protein